MHLEPSFILLRSHHLVPLHKSVGLQLTYNVCILLLDWKTHTHTETLSLSTPDITQDKMDYNYIISFGEKSHSILKSIKASVYKVETDLLICWPGGTRGLLFLRCPALKHFLSSSSNE